jgi:hypothetical protein
MVGEEGRAQVTAGYRQATEEANETHPYSFFLPLASMGSRTLTQNNFSIIFKFSKFVFKI